MKRYLVLEDGSVFEGEGYGASSNSYGEVVFTTSMTGYLESITDPSYRGQILVFAFPTIANYPLQRGRMESDRSQVSGVVTRDAHQTISTGIGTEFAEFLAENGVPAIDGIDTRSLVKKLREKGVMRGWLSDSQDNLVFESDPLGGDLIADAINKEPKVIKSHSNGKNILFVDCGAKTSLLQEIGLIANLQVVPYDYDFNQIEGSYDAVFISNGPGDPASPYLNKLVKFVGDQIGNKKIFGVCLGQQIIARAYGAKTYKMRFGHRGSNHAVTNGQYIRITTHNHGFAVEEESVLSKGLFVIEKDANDDTPEMISDRSNSVLAVQYHPEASPGPFDTKQFFRLIAEELRK